MFAAVSLREERRMGLAADAYDGALLGVGVHVTAVLRRAQRLGCLSGFLQRVLLLDSGPV